MSKVNKSDLELILASSTTPIPNEHKARVYELLCNLKEKAAEPFGAIIVLGYTHIMKKHGFKLVSNVTQIHKKSSTLLGS